MALRSDPFQKSGFYIPGLDGVRGLAVLIVFLFHAQIVPKIPGELGTNAFFFLSGFLITTLFVREWQKTGDISLKSFYKRRVLRILPPLYIVLGLSWAASYWFGVGYDLKAPHVVSNFFQFTNLEIAWTRDKFGYLPGMILLWSLAVDEHFYLLFGPAFKAAVKRVSLQRIAQVLLGLCIATLLWRCWIVYSEGTSIRITMSTDTRLDSILWGAFFALWRNPALQPERARKLAHPALVACSLVALFLPLLTNMWVVRHTVGYTLEAIAFIPLFSAVVLHGQTGWTRFMEWPWLKWIGRISYPLFLLQWLLLEICYEHVPGSRWAQFGTAVVSAFILAATMHYLVERPIARFRQAAKKRKAEDLPPPVELATATAG